MYYCPNGIALYSGTCTIHNFRLLEFCLCSKLELTLVCRFKKLNVYALFETKTAVLDKFDFRFCYKWFQNLTAEFWFCLDNFEILNFQTCLSWKLKKSISQILSVFSYWHSWIWWLVKPSFVPMYFEFY